MHTKRFTKMGVIALFALAAGFMSFKACAGAGWQPYADMLLKDPNVKAGAIYGKDGAIWGERNMKAGKDEALMLANGMKDPKQFQAKGIVVGGVKYMFLAEQDKTIRGRKGSNDILLASSNKAIVVAISKDGANSANIRSHKMVVEDLIKKNF